MNKNIKKPKKITKNLTLHNWTDLVVSKKNRKRVGRGIGSGMGKTSTAGHKGQRSRSGHKIKDTFEGGQTPFHLRIPKKRGFRPFNKLVYQVVNLNSINQKKMKIVNKETLFAEKLISKLNHPVKILGFGNLDFSVIFEINAISKTATAKIEKAQGKIKLV